VTTLVALADARGVLPTPAAALNPRRRSLSCGDCRTPIPAGRVRCRLCAAAARWAPVPGSHEERARAAATTRKDTPR
jgi:hypothetical protein